MPRRDAKIDRLDLWGLRPQHARRGWDDWAVGIYVAVLVVAVWALVHW